MGKQKDPAFLFYSSDFLTGTMFMTNEQIGLYIKMLCIQHQHGGRIDTNVLRTLCDGITNGDTVFAKFVQDERGSFSERLDLEMQKRAAKSVKARESINKRWTKTSYERNTNVIRSKDENRNENENENIGIGGVGERVDRSNYLKVLEKLKSDELFVEGLKKRGNVDLVGLETLYDKFFAKHIGDGKDWPNEAELKKHLGNYVEKVGPTIKKEEEFKGKTVRIAN